MGVLGGGGRIVRLHDRLRRLVDGVPDDAFVSLPAARIRAWLKESGSGGFEADLTVREVGDLFGRSPITVRGWIRTGALRAYRFRGKEWRIPVSALEEFRQEQLGRGKQSQQQ
jgi:excisionase family DNA binding protein